jgi:hypothetical protein
VVELTFLSWKKMLQKLCISLTSYPKKLEPSLVSYPYFLTCQSGNRPKLQSLVSTMPSLIRKERNYISKRCKN